MPDTKTKALIRDLTPPLLWRTLRSMKGMAAGSTSAGDDWADGSEQPAEYYDARFRAKQHWKNHYTKSHYYPLWTVIADRLIHANVGRVLDIGCGPGQVATLLRDRGVAEYLGLDFSPARVDRAREICPEFEFAVANVFATNFLETDAYDCVLTMEFLEHVEGDLLALRRLRPNVLVVATVPNFGGQGHVRHFDSVDAVRNRYAPVLASLRVDPLLANTQGKTFYILQGFSRPQSE